MAQTSATCVALVLFSSPSFADWFSRIDAAGQLQTTAIAVDDDKVLSPVYVDCDANGLRLTFETRHTASGSDEISKPRAVVSFKTPTGNKSLSLVGRVVALPSGSIAVVASLNTEDAKALLVGISRGRVDFSLSGDGLIHEGDVRRIFAAGSIPAAAALRAQCWR